MRRLPDFLVVGQEDWDEVERRNQLLVSALAARNPRTRFLFVERPAHRRGRAPSQVAPNVWVVRTRRPFLDRFALGASLNDRVEERQLRRRLHELGMERPAVWTQDPRGATLVPRLDVSPVVYDLTDDWAAFESDAGRRARVQRRIDLLTERADLVLACSRALARDGAHYLPNAVEPPAPAQPPANTLPVLGYAGTLHDARLDAELLARAAELRPDWRFELLGPDQLGAESRARLVALANVRFRGVVPHDEVRAVLESWDVCLVPHRVTEFTRSLDPLKLYEYLAAGRPVVATPAAIPDELAAHVRIADSAEELVARAEEVMTAHDADAARAAVAGATWDARAAEVERLLGLAQAPAETEVSAIVVSHGTRDLLDRTLAHLYAQQGVAIEAIVVDNASDDGSPQLVRERFPGATLVELRENVGFARANNLAFDRARGDAVLLLNSDCYLAPGALRALVDALRRNPRAAAVGPRLRNPDGTLQRSAWPFPRARRILLEAALLHRPLRRLGLVEDLALWPHDEERAVDFLVGACLLVRRDALDEVGGFDERFWLYGEEADLCRRFAARGWDVVLTPDAEATHVGGASSARSSARLRHFYRGQKRFLRKHSPRGAWTLARAALLLGSLLRGRLRVAAVALDPRL